MVTHLSAHACTLQDKQGSLPKREPANHDRGRFNNDERPEGPMSRGLGASLVELSNHIHGR